jgi:homoserine kinase
MERRSNGKESFVSSFVAEPVSVRVPATSANLGPGFDALGLALTLHDELTAQVTSAGITVEVDGEGTDLPRDESHLVVQSMLTAFDRLGERPAGLALSCRNKIPQGRGLGSSAAAIVAGLALARALVEGGADRLPDADLLALAAELEGHPDNVAPCLLGGLTVAWTVGGRSEAIRLDVDATVAPVLLVPPYAVATSAARGLLPDTVPHEDAVFNAARAALLVAALTGAPDRLFEATDDRLHQPYRASGMPETAALITSLRQAGHAAVLSGAGPTVLVMARGEVETQAIVERTPGGWRAEALAVERRRLRVTRG